MYQVQIIFKRRTLLEILNGKQKVCTFEKANDVEVTEGFLSVEVDNPEGTTSYNYPVDSIGRIRVVNLDTAPLPE